MTARHCSVSPLSQGFHADAACYVCRYLDLRKKFCNVSNDHQLSCEWHRVHNHFERFGSREGRMWSCLCDPYHIKLKPIKIDAGSRSPSQLLSSVYHQKLSKLHHHDAICPLLVPMFTFPMPLDSSHLHGGLTCRFVVFTVLFGKSDVPSLHSFMVPPFTTCYVAFLDERAYAEYGTERVGIPCSKTLCTCKSNSWLVVRIPPQMLPLGRKHTVRNSRVPKMLAHRAFRHAEYAIYFDGKIRLGNQVQLEPLLRSQNRQMGAIWLAPHHPKRSTILEEAMCLHAIDKAKAHEMSPQLLAYQDERFPINLYAEHGGAGLAEGEWHMRDLTSSNATRIACTWADQYFRWNHTRDQLSFGYSVWTHQLLPAQAAGHRYRSFKFYQGIDLLRLADAKRVAHNAPMNYHPYRGFRKRLWEYMPMVDRSTLQHGRKGRPYGTRICDYVIFAMRSANDTIKALTKLAVGAM